MRVWHSPWSWLKEIASADSVAGNTFTGMLTRLTLRKPFQVGRGGICTSLSVQSAHDCTGMHVPSSIDRPAWSLQVAFRGLYSQDPVMRGTALEYLDAVPPPDIREFLWPFLEASFARTRNTPV